MKTLSNTLKTFTKVLAVALTSLPLIFPAQAVDKVLTATYAAATATNLLTGGKYIIKDVLLISTATNSTTVKFYDSSGATNYVKAATTSIASYTTNYSVVFTNAGGLLITNTLSGLYTGSTAVSASTNELPAIVGPALITATGTRTLSDVNVIPLRGLTLYGTGAGTVEVIYEQIAP